MNFNLNIMLTLSLFYISVSVQAATFGSYTKDDIKTDLLNKHNDLRQEDALNRKIAYMSEMRWNDTLTAQAQAYADKCLFKHDDQRGEDVGENMFYQRGNRSLTGVKPLSYAVQKWYDEKQYYTYSDGTCKEGKVCGHYEQVAWAQSKQLGCGVKFCPILTYSTENIKDADLVVCRYVKSRMYKEKPYELGCSACEKCPDNCVRQSLCEYSFTYEKCEDKSDKCKEYKDKGYGICDEKNSNYNFGVTKCRLTCGICKVV